jgi:dolichol kinase
MNLRTSGYIRALVHTTVTLCLAAAVWLSPRPAVLEVLGIVAGLFFIFEYVRTKFRWVNVSFFFFLNIVLRPEEWWRPTGAAYVLWGTMAAAFCFAKEAAVTALAFLAVGDAVSSVIGTYFGTRMRGSARYFRSLGCFISCIIVGAALYYAGFNLTPKIFILAAITTTIVESKLLPINDNLGIPLITGLVISLMSA